MLVVARLKHQQKDLSIADCVGYVTAQRLGVKFLTGDKAFKGMKNVGWVRSASQFSTFHRIEKRGKHF